MRRLIPILFIIFLLSGPKQHRMVAVAEPKRNNACLRLLPKGSLLSPPQLEGAGQLGLAVHTLILDESSAQLATEAGFETVVQVFPWKDLEPMADQFDWAVADAMVALAEQYQLELVLRLDMPPTWANRPVTKGLPIYPTAYADFVSQVANRYQGRIKGYIIWNEPNLAAEWSRSGGDLNSHFVDFNGWVADPADYAGLVGLAYDHIRAADPDALVIAGGLAPTNEHSARANDDRDFLRQLYAVDWQHCFDILAVHDYGFGLPADTPIAVNNGLNLSRVEALREIMLANGDDRPVWITELGYTLHSSTHPPVSEMQQSEYLIGAYERTATDWPWIELFTVWNLTTGRSPDDEMSGYSLVNPDGSPRPAFKAFADLNDGRN